MKLINGQIVDVSCGCFVDLSYCRASIKNVLQVYWPFDNSKVYSVTTGDNRTEIQLPTHDTIVAVASTYQPQLLIDFINPDPYSYGNWPRGYCHGPYPLGK